MEEQIISFETAKLAREKGCKLSLYHENRWSYFENNDEFICNYDPRKEYPNAKQIIICNQTLLQKWIRDVHNIHISLDYGSLNKKWMFAVYKCDIEGKLLKDEFPIYPTYEEALEAGLQEALKVI